MKGLLKGGPPKGQKGVMSEDMIHRIDSMNDEAEAEGHPYMAKKKTRVETEEMFNESVYDAEESSDEISGKTIGIILGVIVVIIAVIVAVICLT